MDFGARHIAVGIDIGGSGIKGGVVDLQEGTLLTERVRRSTPRPATPDAVAAVVGKVLGDLDVPGGATVGITFPGIIAHGECRSAANMDGDWVGRDMVAHFAPHVGTSPTVLNDADAAGLAETRYGAGKGMEGVVMMLTLGTGIGSALINNGVLVPNLELGHLEIDGYNAESRAAASVKDAEGLTYAQWAERLQRYFETLEFLFSPDAFVIGGGVSRDHEQFLPLLTTRAPLIPAELRNAAGIVGAALHAKEQGGE